MFKNQFFMFNYRISKLKSIFSISFLYASRTGTAEKFTNEVLDYISTFNPGMPIEKINVKDSDIQTIEALFTEKAKNKLYVMVIASYPDDEFCENLKAYFEESAVDWRVGKGHLQKAGIFTFFTFKMSTPHFNTSRPHKGHFFSVPQNPSI